MKQLWLDIGNTRLKYWITQNETVIEHAAELHLQSPSDLLLGLIQHFNHQNIQKVGVSSVLDQHNNDRIRSILKRLHIPMIMARYIRNMLLFAVVMIIPNSSGLIGGFRYLLLHSLIEMYV